MRQPRDALGFTFSRRPHSLPGAGTACLGLRSLLLALVTVFLVFALAQRAPAEFLVYFKEDDGGGNRGLYNFDPVTGVSTLRTPVGGTERFFALAARPSDGTVFAVDPGNNGLYTINIDTGAFRLVASLGGSNDVANFAFNPLTDTLYGLGRNSHGLFIIDPTTGQRTPVGTTSATRAGLDFAPGGDLFGTTIDGLLYRLDPANANETLIGGSRGLLVEDAAFTAAGEMFVTDFSGGIYRYDTATGARTLVGTTGLGLLGIIAGPGIAPAPEPAGLTLIGLGGLILLGHSWLRRRRAGSTAPAA
jgi:DNA-binding beta-propeller fold protein YncE